MNSRAPLPAASLLAMTLMVSYQAPASALPSAGFSPSVLVLTIIMSMISPGIWLESYTSVLLGLVLSVVSCGFQVTTAVTAGVA
jgi:hypothetical protein